MRNVFSGCLGNSRRDVNLLIVGIDNAGKSTTVASMQREPANGITPTIGFASSSFQMRGCDVTVYDLGGGSQIRGIWKNYYAEVHGIIFVIDASDPQRIGESRDVLEEVVKDRRMSGKPLLLLANKNDVDGAMDEIDVCNQLKVRELMEQEQFDCQVEQCVALKQKSDRAIRRGMKWLLDSISKGYSDLSERVNADVAVQREEEAREKAERAERVRKLREERKRQEEAAGVKEDDDDEVDNGGAWNPFVPIDEHIQSVEQKARENGETLAKPEKPEIQEKQPKQSSSSSDDIVISKPFPMPSPRNAISASAPSLSNGCVKKVDIESVPSIEVKKPKKKKIRKNKVGVMPPIGVSQSVTSIDLPPIRGRVRPVWMRSDDGSATDLPPSELQYLR